MAAEALRSQAEWGSSLMAKRRSDFRPFDGALQWLRDHGFDLLEAPGAPNRFFLKKYGCSAAIEKAPDGGAKVFAHPGYLMSGEIAKLVDRGYQKFLKTTKTEVPATAEHLIAIHDFSEELKEALRRPSLYNESLGTVSDAYVYDRVNGREAPNPPQRPWEAHQRASEEEEKKRA